MEVGAELVQAHVGLRDALAGLLQHHAALRPAAAQLSILREAPSSRSPIPDSGDSVGVVSSVKRSIRLCTVCFHPAGSLYLSLLWIDPG